MFFHLIMIQPLINKHLLRTRTQVVTSPVHAAINLGSRCNMTLEHVNFEMFKVQGETSYYTVGVDLTIFKTRVSKRQPREQALNILNVLLIVFSRCNASSFIHLIVLIIPQLKLAQNILDSCLITPQILTRACLRDDNFQRE